MAPRKYSMKKRAASMERTRSRILEAAMALYQEQPVESTSMQEVARRADVAPGTVLNHFPDPDELVEAVVDELVDTLRVPGPEIFEGRDSMAERLGALAEALGRFFERAAPWFHVHEREARRVEAFGRGAREFEQRVTALIEEALGERATPRSVGVVRTLTSPGAFGQLRRMEEMSMKEAARLVTEILVAWLERNSRTEEER